MSYLRAKAITTPKRESELQNKIMKKFLIKKRGWSHKAIATMPLRKFFKLFKQECV